MRTYTCKETFTHAHRLSITQGLKTYILPTHQVRKARKLVRGKKNFVITDTGIELDFTYVTDRFTKLDRKERLHNSEHPHFPGSWPWDFPLRGWRGCTETRTRRYTATWRQSTAVIIRWFLYLSFSRE
eukprot:1349983-Amorphochlora_amoeboformis.AAC.1